MKTTIKDLKEFKFPLTEEEQAILLDRISTFEKELKEKLLAPNLGEWLRKNSDAQTMQELFSRFIEKEIFGHAC